MLKSDLEKQNKELKERIDELENRAPITKDEVERLIISVVSSSLTLKEEYGFNNSRNISLSIDGSYIGSFNINGD